MARYERVAEIYGLLSASSEPLSLESLCGSLNASSATVKRLVRFLREEMLVPVEFDREQRGYRIHRDARGARPVVGPSYDLDELSALMTAYDVLDQIPPGLFRKETLSLRQRLTQLVDRDNGQRGAARGRIRLLMPQRRQVDKQRFGALLSALEKERRLRIRYVSRTRDGETERVVSPQRLTFYRSNWYLAAWCHVGRDLRVFAVDRIAHADITPFPAHLLDGHVLEARLASGYGILEGEANAVAILKFNAAAARWVADEEWHPKQTLERLPDGGVLLQVPYRHSVELRMDLLRYGADVEVLGPPALRAEVAATLSAATSLYG